MGARVLLLDDTCDVGSFVAEFCGSESRVVLDANIQPSIFVERQRERYPDLAAKIVEPLRPEQVALEERIKKREVTAVVYSHDHGEHTAKHRRIAALGGIADHIPEDDGNNVWGWSYNDGLHLIPVPKHRHRSLPAGTVERYPMHGKDRIVRYATPHGSHDGGILRSSPHFGHVITIDDAVFYHSGDKHGRLLPVDIAMIEATQPDVVILDGINMNTMRYTHAQYEALHSMYVMFGVLKRDAQVAVGHHGTRFDPNGDRLMPQVHHVAAEAGFRGPVRMMSELPKENDSIFHYVSVN